MTERSIPYQLPSTERSLPIALIRAREKVMAPIRDMLSETGITEQQWRVLRVLSERDSIDATDLADKASLHQPSLTRMLKTLSEKDLIARTKDKDDRRRQVVVLTEAGRQVIEDNMAQATRISEAFMTHLGQDEFDNLLNLLTRLDDFTFGPSKDT